MSSRCRRPPPPSARGRSSRRMPPPRTRPSPFVILSVIPTESGLRAITPAPPIFSRVQSTAGQHGPPSRRPLSAVFSRERRRWARMRSVITRWRWRIIPMIRTCGRGSPSKARRTSCSMGGLIQWQRRRRM